MGGSQSKSVCEQRYRPTRPVRVLCVDDNRGIIAILGRSIERKAASRLQEEESGWNLFSRQALARGVKGM
jgi:hypothetical protein